MDMTLLSAPAPAAAVPDMGDLFRHDDHGFRVSGWMKLVPGRPLDEADKWLFEGLGLDFLPYYCKPYFVWCMREDATHVTGTGVCGVRLPVSDVKVDGKVGWSEAQIEEERDRARRMAGTVVGMHGMKA